MGYAMRNLYDARQLNYKAGERLASPRYMTGSSTRKKRKIAGRRHWRLQKEGSPHSLILAWPVGQGKGMRLQRLRGNGKPVLSVRVRRKTSRNLCAKKGPQMGGSRQGANLVSVVFNAYANTPGY